ncbi:hypothetical protein [Halothiobacillus sp.]|uniref:hypothetical protein n=1 Tax=Halothiobacillus sp. TaxID=1891311 RepID=UPI003D0CBD0D
MKRIASNGLGRISSGTVMATCLPIRTVARGMDDYLTEKKTFMATPDATRFRSAPAAYTELC